MEGIAPQASALCAQWQQVIPHMFAVSQQTVYAKLVGRYIDM
jgi:hypothetical protein